MSAEAKLTELGISLPEVATPVASYVNAVKTGNLLYLSGGLPDLGNESHKAVSYTHLTLPTIYSV